MNQGDYDSEEENPVPNQPGIQQMAQEFNNNQSSINKSGNMSMMMQNLQGAILAKAFLPEPKAIKDCLQTLDTAIKFQVVIFELSSILFWCSLAEIFLFWFSFLLFCTDVTHMGMIWLHLLHVLRGLCGAFILLKMPNTYDLLKEVKMDDHAKVPIEQIQVYAKQGAVEMYKAFSAKCNLFLMIYCIMTLVTVGSDGVSFFFAISRFENEQTEFSFAGVCLLALTALYFTVEFYYLMWLASQMIKMPSEIGLATVMGLIGISSKMNTALNIETVKAAKKQTDKSKGKKGGDADQQQQQQQVPKAAGKK